jgi:hypothetical protein
MISEDTKKQKHASGPVWFSNLPPRIQPGGAADSRLAGVPANLFYSQIADPATDTQTARLLSMLFDPAKLVGDELQLSICLRRDWR